MGRRRRRDFRSQEKKDWEHREKHEEKNEKELDLIRFLW